MITILISDIKKTISMCLALLLLLVSSTCYAVANNKVESTSKLKWHYCKSEPHFLCTNVSVPLDYKHPQFGKISLPVKMHLATKKSFGYLFFNFGGPWANDVAILPSILKKRLTPTMIAHYNLLVMNPRGVSPNTIECHSKQPSKLKEINESLMKIFSQGNESDLKQLYRLMKEKHRLCQYNKLSKYASTVNSVQDIETLRKALHIKKLNFYMDSYGTRLGQAYLVKYPKHVQRIVLDGNIAPSNQFMSLINARAYGAVTTFNAFFHYCFKAGNKCVLNKLISNTQQKSTAALINWFEKFLKKVRQSHGIPTSSQYANRPITVGMLANLVYTEMSPSHWKNLAKALYEAEKNNSGSALMKIYMANTGYNPINNRYSIGSNATRSSVICEGYIIPNFNKEAVWMGFIHEIHSKYSTIGTVSTLWIAPICINWHVKSSPLLPIPTKIVPHYTYTPHVLIIGNLQDPMTPFTNALAVKKYLKKFNIPVTLLKWNGLSHTAILTDSPLSTCVFRYVDKFLLRENLPRNIACNDWQNPFTRNSK